MRISDWSSDVCSSDLVAGSSATAESASAGGISSEGNEISSNGSSSWDCPYARGTAESAMAAVNPRSTSFMLYLLHRLRRSEEHTSELQSLMRISYAVFCLKKKNKRENLARLHQHMKHNLKIPPINNN